MKTHSLIVQVPPSCCRRAMAHSLASVTPAQAGPEESGRAGSSAPACLTALLGRQHTSSSCRPHTNPLNYSPSGPMLKVASASGCEGEAMILATRVSPRPLRSCRRVVVACAMILPPTALSCAQGGRASQWAGVKYGSTRGFSASANCTAVTGPVARLEEQAKPCKQTAATPSAVPGYPTYHAQALPLCEVMPGPELTDRCGAENMAVAPSRLPCTTWLVTSTATPYSSARRCRPRRKRPSWF